MAIINHLISSAIGFAFVLWLIFITLFPTIVCADVINDHGDKFNISISSIDAPFAIVSAQINVENGRLATGSGGSYDWKRGWADFISEVTAKTLTGDTLNVSEQGEGFESYWLITNNGEEVNDSIQLNYKVNLSYTRKEWDFGNEQAGRIYKRGLYSVTKPFFMSTDNEKGAEVSFDLPAGWSIAAPWHELGDGRYLTKDFDTLQSNAFTVGHFESERTSLNGFDVEIILIGNFKGAPPLVAETLSQVLPVYLDIFPETPKAKYMMFYLEGKSEDAEAFKNGAAFTTSLALSADNRIFWADFLAHELFHFWNGVRIRANNRWEGNWFSEGFTDYYANLVLVNQGILSGEWFVRRMENIFGNYLWFHFSSVFDGLSVLEAGKEKGRNRFGVYDAGWVLAFALDDEIKRRSGGKKTLDDAMKAIYERYGTAAERYDLDDLIDLISKSTELDLVPFFDRYLKARNPLPLRQMMKSFGWSSYSNSYANEYYLIKDDAASDQSKARWNYLLHNRFE